MSVSKDIGVEKHGHVTLIEIRRPPLNFFDLDLIRQIADALDAIDSDTNARAVVLASQGKAFCAGANFARPVADGVSHAYVRAEQRNHFVFLRTPKPEAAKPALQDGFSCRSQRRSQHPHPGRGRDRGRPD